MMNTETSFTQVTSDTLQDSMKVCFAVNRPLFIWGNPGIGKSDAVRQIAKYYEDQGQTVLLLDIRASQLDAVDTRGVPFTYVDKSQAEIDGAFESALGEVRRTGWAVPDLFPSAAVAAKYDIVILFFDELNNAPPSTQAALYQIMLDRKLGAYTLPDNCKLVAAGNMETDRGATHRMATPLASRFFHEQLIVDARGWEKWALGDADIHTAVVSYIRWRPEHLHDFDPKSKSKAQADPRGWEMISDVLQECERAGINGQVEAALISGKLGEAIGAEFIGFLPIYRNLPDPDGVILAPDAADIPSDPATMYALCGALASRATESNIASVLKYAERVNNDKGAGPEFMTLLVRQCAIKNPSIQSTRGFIKWATDNPDVLIG